MKTTTTTAQPSPLPIPEGKPNPAVQGPLFLLTLLAIIWGFWEIRAWRLRSMNQFKKPGESKKIGLSRWWFRDWGN